MKTKQHFLIGSDISKKWFDATLLVMNGRHPSVIETKRFDNTKKGFICFLKWLIKNGVTDLGQALLVMENTGLYNRLLWVFCQQHGLPVHVGNAAEIKWSFGLTRGKNDAVDSRRLAEYAAKNAWKLKPTPAPSPELWQLKDLVTARTKMLRQKTALSVHLGELRGVNSPEVQQIMEAGHRAALEGLKASIKAVEAEIKRIIRQDEALWENYKLVKTVPGVGHVIAVYLICCTNNFTRLISGKQLACYAGVVPFEHSSGSSVRGRSRVSHMANKELKRLLHLGALSVRTHNPEFRGYYERKKAEGKHSMCVLNAIRNKIVLRVAAVIKAQQPYVSQEVKMAA